jgi:hypothetical protein
MRFPTASLIAFIMIITITSVINPSQQGYTDSLKSAIKQRIGNYEGELVTDPKNPVIGENSRILLRFGSVNGEDLIDVPIAIRIVKDNIVLEQTQQILVPYGHYSYDYVFPESGRYILYVNVNDVAYSKQTLNFIYFIDIAESSIFSLSLAIIVVVVTVGVTLVVSMIFVQRKKKRAIKNTKK